MKLRYETGIATMTQFIVLGIMNLISNFYLSTKSCVKGEDCVTTIFLNIIIFVLIGIGLAFTAALGYAAQERRSKRLSQLLIAVEGGIGMISLLTFQHYENYFSRLISAIGIGMAIWVSILAFRLMRSGGGRITARKTSQRPRQRKKPTYDQA